MPHNMVALCRMRGLSAQRAFDTLGELLYSRLAKWDESLTKLPAWASGVDSQINNYIEVIKNLMNANLKYRYVQGRHPLGNQG
jgi:hypothetical protein